MRLNPTVTPGGDANDRADVRKFGTSEVLPFCCHATAESRGSQWATWSATSSRGRWRRGQSAECSEKSQIKHQQSNRAQTKRVPSQLIGSKLKRDSKLAVTVGFEPKEAGSISIRINPNPRNSAACDAPGSAAVLSESARINIVCGHHVGTSNYVRAARRPVAAAGRTQRRRTTRPALAFGVDVMRRPV